MTTIIEDFKSNLKAGNVSRNTVKSYVSDLYNLETYLVAHLRERSLPVNSLNDCLHFLDGESILSYKNQLIDSGVPTPTVNRRLSTVRKFAKFLSDQGITALDLSSLVSNIQAQKPAVSGTDINMAKAVDDFSKYLEKENSSANTIKNYLSDARRFLSSPAIATKNISLITSKDIKAYTSSKRTLYGLHKFFTFAVEKNIISTNPVTQVLFPTPLASKLKSRLASLPIIATIAEKVTLPAVLQSPKAKVATKYLGVSTLILLAMTTGIGVYEQFFARSDDSQAYTTTGVKTPKRYLSFQGRLLDEFSTPVTTTKSTTFKLYNVSTGGVALWTGTCDITPDPDGIFSTLLGSGCGTEIDASVFSENTQVWLGVEVDSDGEADPRVQIATVGYALNSETVQGYPIDATGSATRNSIVTMNNGGEIIIAEASPTMKSISGTFAIEGQAITLRAPDTSNGSININPDGTGTLNLTFEGAAPGGSANGFVNATNASITSGSLYYGEAATDATGYNLITLASGTSPTSKFTVDYAGNTSLASGADLSIGGIGLNDNGTSSSGATLVGLYDDSMSYISANTTVQNAIKELDNALIGIGTSAGTNVWQKNGTLISPATITDNIAIGTTVASTAMVYLPGSTNNNAWFNLGTGKLGVGTTTPNAKLAISVSGGASITSAITNSAIRILDTNQGATAKYGISWQTADSGQDYTIAAIEPEVIAGWDTHLNFYTRQGGTLVNALHLNEAGRVGIGTTTPQSKLDVEGGAVIGATYSGTSVAPSNGLIIEGNVGIGITAPTQKLDVAGYVNIAGDKSVQFGGYNVLTSTSAGGNITLRSSSGDLIFTNASTVERMRINSTGKIGIGTSLPGTNLSIVGGVGIGTTDSYANAAIAANNLAVQGNVGIGVTAPTQNLHVSGNARITGAIYDSNNEAGDNTKVLSSTAGGAIDWIDLSAVGVSGTGTANYLPKWSAAAVLTNSMLYENATGVGIGVTSIGGTLPSGWESHADSRVLEINSMVAGRDTGVFIRRGLGATGLDLWSDGSNGDTYIDSRYDSSAGDIFVRTRTAGTPVNALTILGIGNVGIGTTTPQSKLDVEGGAVIGATYSGTSVAPSNGLIVEGNVGIGVTVPSAPLHIKKAYASNWGQFAIQDPTGVGSASTIYESYYDSAGTRLATFGFGRYGGTNDPNYYFANEQTNGAIQFRNASAPIFTVLNGGNVGIAVTNPVNKLDIEGGAVIGATYSGTSTAPTNGLLVEGNVGIGTTSPARPLHVIGTAIIERNADAAALLLKRTGANTKEFFFGLSAEGVNNGFFQIADYGAAEEHSPYNRFIINNNGDIGLGSSGSNSITSNLTNASMVVLGSGNVGIGTTSPEYKLDVNGDIRIATGSELYSNGSATLGNRTYTDDNYVTDAQTFTASIDALDIAVAGIGASGITGTGTSNYLPKWNTATSLTNSLLFDDGANVGIGTSLPGAMLHVGTGTTSHPLTTNDVYITGKLELDGALYLDGGIYDTDGTLTMSLDADEDVSFAGDGYFTGNVGVGTTAPGTKLSIAGGVGIGTTDSFANAAIAASNLAVQGKIGAGVSNPVNKLDVEGGAVIGTTYSGTTTSPTNGLLVEGYVGLGNTSASTLLDVYHGNITIYDSYWMGSSVYNSFGLNSAGTATANSSSDFFINIDSDASTTDKAFIVAKDSTSYSGGTELFKVFENGNAYVSGNLGIATTSPLSALDVRTGNVGIGTTMAATQKLDVQGNARITGAIYDSNNEAGTNTKVLSSTAGGAIDWIDLSAVGVSGTGTANYLPKWSAAAVLTNSLLFDDGTNVGIGTTSPQEKFAIYDSTSAYNLVATNTTGDVGLDLIETTSGNSKFGTANNYGFRIKYEGADSDNRLYIQSAEGTTINTRLAIDRATGSVGIGVTNPVNKLDVEGGAVIGATYSGTSVAPTNGLLVEGNVGIGVTSPYSPLHINAKTVSSISRGFTVDATSLGNQRAILGGFAYLDSRTDLLTDTSYGMIVSNNDTTNNNYASFGFSMNGGNSIAGLVAIRNVNHSSLQSDIAFVNRNSSLQETLTIRYTGSVGIGTTVPGAKLSVVGGVGIGTTDSFANAAIAANNLAVQGNVGIGTTSPSEKLDLVGNAKISTRTYVPGTSGTTGQGYFTGTSSTPLGAFQSANISSTTYNFFATNKYYNGTDWADMGLGRLGSSFQMYNDAFTFFSFDTANNYTARMTMAPGGNFGVGPGLTPGSLLSVNGGMSVGSSYYTTAAPSNGAAIQGNVGIGTTSPQSKLDVEGGAVIGATYSGTSTAPANGLLVEGNMGVGTSSPLSALDVRTGNVGIGTTMAATQKLDIQGNARITGAIYDSNNEAGTNTKVLSSTAGGAIDWIDLSAVGVSGTGTANYIPKWSAAAVLTNSLLYDNGTNVGIGTTVPGAKLQVGTGTSTTVGQIVKGEASQTANLQEWQNSSGTALSYVTKNGAFRSAYTETADADYTHNSLGLDVNPGANISKNFFALSSYVQKLGAYNNTSQDMVGANVSGINAGSGTVSSLIGLYAKGSATSTGPTTDLSAGKFYLMNTGAGTVTRGYGIYINSAANSGGGVIGTNYGLYIGDQTAGSVDYSIYTGLGDSSLGDDLLLRNDNDKIQIGAGGDLDLYHDGTNSIIANATGYLDIQSAGNTVFSTGNVGIGTTSPVAKLDVNGTFNSTGGLAGGQFIISNSAGNMIIGAESAHNLGIQTQGGVKMTILTGGNVGIGTTSPEYKLDVNGDIRIASGSDLYVGTYGLNDNGSANSGASLVGLYDDTMTYITANTTVQTAIKQLDSAMVGIGGSNYWSRSSLNTLSPATITDSIAIGTTVPSTAVAYIPGATNNNAWFNLGTGNLGIGTTVPGAKLHISAASGTAYDAMRLSSDMSYNFRLDDYGTGAGQDLGINFSSGSVRNIVFFNSGALGNNGLRIGIGTTSPKSILDVEGGAVIGATYSGTSVAPTNGLLVEGNVGIATTSPLAKLDVNGDVRIGTAVSLADNNSVVTLDSGIVKTIDTTAWVKSGLKDLVAGNGLTGSADDVLVGTDSDVTLAIGAGNGISVAADAVAVNEDYGFSWTNSHTWTLAGTETLTMTNTGTGLSLKVEDEATDASPFVIDAAGNVGVGTTAPWALLSVGGAQGTTNLVTIGNNQSSDSVLVVSTDASSPAIQTWNNNQLRTQFGLNLNFANGAQARWFSDDSFTTEKANIDGSNGNAWFGGNVGVGVTSPTQSIDTTGDLRIGGDDLFMGTNTTGYMLVADGTNYNPVAISGDITINSSGVTAIGNDKVTEAMLKSVNGSTDEYCLTYEQTTGDFEWQSCASGSITGSGTDNYIPRWNGTTALENSVIFDDGTNIGIGTTVPGAKLDVNGGVVATGVTVGTLTGMIKGTTGSLSAVTSTPNYVTYWSDANTISGEQYLALSRGGTNADLSGASEGGLVYKGATTLSATGALTGILQGNGSSAPTSITGTANYLPKWGATAPYLTASSLIFDNGTGVGIGTSLPTKGKLNVLGSLAVGSTAYTESTGAAPTNGIIVEGNLGIGTTSPTDMLTINGGKVGINYLVNKTLGMIVKTGNSYGGMWSNYGVSSTYRDRLIISANYYKDDAGTDQTSSSRVPAAIYMGGTSSAYNPFDFYVGTLGAAPTTSAMTITAAAKIGLGTTAPGTKLGIVGGVGIGTTDSFSNAAIAANNLAVQGSIGVGTTSPTQSIDTTGDLRIGGDDLFMGTNTDGYILVADGTNYNPVSVTGDISITNAGVTAIGNDKVTEAMLKSVNGSTDEYCLTYEQTTGDFEWQLCSTGSVTGSGTDNYIPRWNGTTALENSIIYDNGTNIGIGTSLPGVRIDVTGTHTSGIGIARFKGDSIYGFITPDTATTTNGAASGFLLSIAGTKMGQVEYNVNSNTNIGGVNIYNTVADATNPKIKINDAGNIILAGTSGNVGIGTTSLAAKLDINGDVKIGTATTMADNNSVVSLDSGIVKTISTTAWVKAGLKDLVAGNGLTGSADDVLVGTDSDVTLAIGAGNGISVAADAVAVNEDFAFNWTNSQTWTTAGTETLTMTNTGTGLSLKVEDEATDTSPFVIDDAGNVGIGVTAPTQNLHVSGNARITGAIYDSNNEAGTNTKVLSSTAGGAIDWIDLSAVGVSGTGTANYLPKWSAAAVLTNSLLFDDGTNVGIGTTVPGYKLDVAGSANLTTGNAYYIAGTSVLNATTLGTNVVTSSLTTVGALASGSIASGFGNISTGNTITTTGTMGTAGTTTFTGAGMTLTSTLSLAAPANLAIGTTTLAETTAANDSGAYLVGLFDDTMTYIDGNTTVQGAIKEIDTAMGTLSGSAGGWTDDGTIVRLATMTDKVGIGTTNPTYSLGIGTSLGVEKITFDGNTGNIVTAGTLAVNGDSITADGVTLVINAGGNVDIQDALNADSITSDSNITVAAGSDLYIGTIGLNDVGSSTTSGAYLVGLEDDSMQYITADTTVQGAIKMLDTSMQSLSGSAGGWTDDGTYVRLSTTTDSVGIGVTNPSQSLAIGIGATVERFTVAGASGNTYIGGTLQVVSTSDLQGSLANSTGNLVLADTVDLFSGTTGLRVDTDGLLTDIDDTAISIDDDISFVGAQQITTSTGDLTLSPAGNLVINTTGGTVDIDDATIDLSTQATAISLKASTVNALGIGGTALMSFDTANGRVGIGLTDPAYKLDVTGDLRVTGHLGLGTANPLSYVTLNASETFTSDDASAAYGLLLQPTFNIATGSTTTHNYFGAYIQATGTAGVGTTRTLQGLIARANSSGTEDYYTGYGIRGEVYNYEGTMDIARGVYGYIGQLGTGGTGVITSAAAGFFDTGLVAGTITNSYGVYIDSIAGTNTWGIYQNTATNQNYFAGNVGVGVSAPGAELDLSYVSTSAGDETGLHITNTAPSGDKLLEITGGTGISSGSYLIYAEGDDSGKTFVARGDGRVGIGTSLPAYKLDVSTGTTDSVAQFASTDDLAQILIADNDTTGYFGAKDSRAFFGTNTGLSVNNLIVDGSGNVGLGVTNPQVELQIGVGTSLVGAIADDSAFIGGSLQVNQFIYTNEGLNNLAGTGVVIIGGASNTDVTLANDLAVGGDGYFVGNVGIGTTDITYDLHVANTTNPTLSITNMATGLSAGDVIGTLDFASSGESSLTNAHYPFAQIGTVSQSTVTGTASLRGALTFSTANTTDLIEQMRIDTYGNIGIGTTAPLAALNVISPATADDTVNQQWAYSATSNGDTGYNFKLKQNVSSGNVRWTFEQVNNGTSYADVLTFDRGNVGIGNTSPQYQLAVAGTAYFSGGVIYNNSTTNYWANSANDYNYFYTSNGYIALGPANASYAHIYTDITGGFYLNENMRIAANTHHFADSGNNSFINKGGGNVGIGTSVPTKGTLSVLGSVAIGSTAYTEVAGAAPSNGLIVEGGIGIGVTAIGATDLKVNGEVILGSKLYMGSAAAGGFFLGSSGYTSLNSGGFRITDLASDTLYHYICVDTDGDLSGGHSCNTSSVRYKEDVRTIDNALDLVNQLDGVRFKWKPEYGGYEDIGFIAEEVGKIFPSLVEWEEDGVHAKTLQYDKLTAVNTQAIKELNNKVDTIASFTKGILANIETGAVVAMDISTDTLTAYSLEVLNTIKAGALEATSISSDTISTINAGFDYVVATVGIKTPKIETASIATLPGEKDINVQIGNGTTVSGFGELLITNPEGVTVASIDEAGNATFSGELVADEVKTNEIIATKIYADEIISRSGKFGEIDTQNLKDITREQIEEILRSAEQDQKLLLDTQDWNTNTASASAVLASTIQTSDLFVTGNTALTNLSVSKSLAMGSDLVMTSEVEVATSLPKNTLNTLVSPLEIQSLALAPVEIMAGKFRIDTNGDVTLEGNLYVAGVVEAEGVKIKEKDNNLLLTLQDKTGTDVANINASGSATFKQVEASGLTIAGANTDTPVINELGEIQSNATAGKGILPSYNTEVTIRNEKVNANTLIYITPTTSTENKVMYIKSKGDGFFTVGFNEFLASDVEFNWWIVELKQ